MRADQNSRLNNNLQQQHTQPYAQGEIMYRQQHPDMMPHAQNFNRNSQAAPQRPIYIDQSSQQHIPFTNMYSGVPPMHGNPYQNNIQYPSSGAYSSGYTSSISASSKEYRPNSASTNLSQQDMYLPSDYQVAQSSITHSSTQPSHSRRLFTQGAPASAGPLNSNMGAPSASYFVYEDQRQNTQAEATRGEMIAGDSIFSRPPSEGFQLDMNSVQVSSQQQSERYGELTSQRSGETRSTLEQHHHQMLVMEAQSQDQSQNTYKSSSGSSTQIGRVFRMGSSQMTNEVMINNIDKATIQYIAQELHNQDVIDISQNLIAQNILIVRFRTPEGAQWAINKYDGQTINGRELKVVYSVNTAHKRNRRGVKVEPTNLAQITETNEIDEDFEYESSIEMINYPNQQFNSPPQQQNQEFLNAVGSNHNQARSKSQIAATNSQQAKTAPAIVQGQNYPPNFTGIANQSKPFYQSFNEPENSYRAQPIALQRPQTTQHQNQGTFNLQASNTQPSHMHSQSVNYSEAPLNYDPNQQYQQKQFNQQQVPPHFAPHYDHMRNTQQPAYYNQQQLAHSMTQPFNGYMTTPNTYTPQDVNYGHQGFQSQHLQYGVGSQIARPNSALGRNDMNLLAGNKVYNQDKLAQTQMIDPNHQRYQFQMGGIPVNQQLSLAQLPQPDQQFLQNCSSSIDISQQDEIDNYSQQNLHDQHYSGSERGSTPFNQIIPTRNGVVTSSTRNSDSDNQLQFHQAQQFQSPVSARKMPESNSFDYNRASNSGHDTPPLSHRTPNSNYPNNSSLNQMNGYGTSSQQSLNQIRVENTQHNRNLSHNQQLTQLIGQPEPNLFMNYQQFNHKMNFPQNNSLYRSMSYANINQFQNSFLDFPDQSQPFQMTSSYHPHHFQPQDQQLSSSNSSFDISNTSMSKSKKKGSFNTSQGYKSHQSLKHKLYSESSLTSLDYACNHLNLERIKTSEDTRTTVMVRHIPNKYTQRLLLKEINVNNQGKYDFFYLPIDYQNSANVGYAFVNFVHHHFILDFYNEFHNRKWTNFNSKKRCEIKYGRIQGLEELKRHFQASSVMNQSDENFRPRIFEQHNKMDWTSELRKISDKYKISGPQQKSQSYATNLSQSSQVQYSAGPPLAHQQSIGSNNTNTLAQSFSNLKLSDAPALVSEESKNDA